MSDSVKRIFVNERTWNKIIEELRYEPSNLVVNKYIPENEGLIIDTQETNKTINTPFFKGYKPDFYFRTK